MAGANYYSYLLRLWKEGSGDSVIWRITLEVPQTRQILNFSTLESLADYLQQKMMLPDPHTEERRDRKLE